MTFISENNSNNAECFVQTPTISLALPNEDFFFL